MSDGVLIEREGRLEFYPQPGSPGYAIDRPWRVRAYRGAFIAAPILTILALVAFGPHSLWIAGTVIFLVLVAVELLRRILFLHGLPRTEEALDSKIWRGESALQSSVYVALVSTAGIALVIITAGLTVSTTRTVALIRYGVVFSVTYTLLRQFQIRRQRRLFGIVGIHH